MLYALIAQRQSTFLVRMRSRDQNPFRPSDSRITTIERSPLLRSPDSYASVAQRKGDRFLNGFYAGSSPVGGAIWQETKLDLAICDFKLSVPVAQLERALVYETRG